MHFRAGKTWKVFSVFESMIPLTVTCYTLRLRQDGRHFPDDIFKWIFLNEIIWIAIKISLKFVPSGPINNIPALVQIMAWRRSGDKPLSEPMMVNLLMHICVTQSQWVNSLALGQCDSNFISLISWHVTDWVYKHFVKLSSGEWHTTLWW